MMWQEGKIIRTKVESREIMKIVVGSDACCLRFELGGNKPSCCSDKGRSEEEEVKEDRVVPIF